MVVRVNNGRNQSAKKLEGSFCLVSVSLGPISKQLEVFFFSFFFPVEAVLFEEGKSSILSRSSSF